MVFSRLGQEIPLTSIELLVCEGPIPVAPWATPGTEPAGKAAVECFQSRNNLQVMLLRQHRLVAIGQTLEEAYCKAVNAEIGMEVYYKARLLGDVQTFSPTQLQEIREIYGI